LCRCASNGRATTETNHQAHARQESEMAWKQVSDTVGRIAMWAGSVAAISFAVGYVGPIFLSGSSLGPLLGIFVTGPLGALAGVLVGALRVVRDAPRLTVALVGAVWAASLLYTLFMIGIAAQGAIVAIPLQVLVIAATVFLLAAGATRVLPPNRRLGLIALATQAIILATTLFPPVVKPWWVPARFQDSTPAPRIAFIFDGRFDAGRHFPLFAVARSELALEWAIVIAVAIGLGLLARRRQP
jgi:hypothetical protein